MENMHQAKKCGDPTGNMTTLYQKYNTGSPPAYPTYGISSIIVCFNGYIFNDGSFFKTTNYTLYTFSYELRRPYIKYNNLQT